MKYTWVRYWPWALLALMAVCIFAMNVWCIPAHDELSYAFTRNPDIPSSRIGSLSDIVRQQYWDYLHYNCRVLIHSVVTFFSAFRLYTLFDALNTGMWFLLAWLVLRESHVTLKKDGKTLFFGACVVWWFLWYAETCCMNAAFAVNYLWTACVTVVMMALWRHLTHWWMVPLAFLYGWSQETFVLPMLVALAGGAFLRSINERRLVFTSKQAVAWILMLAGACFLCFGPGSFTRAQGVMGSGADFLLITCVKSTASLLLLGAPVLLFGALLWVVWRNRKGLWPMLLRSPEWWCGAAASYGFVCLVGGSGVIVRLSMMLLLSVLILVLRERSVFRIGNKTQALFFTITLLWMMSATAYQAVIGEDLCQSLRIYRSDPQGITVRKAYSPGIFFCTIYNGIFNRGHGVRFQRELSYPCAPAFFTPWLYDSLYRHPSLFFAEAKELTGSGLFVASCEPKAVVMRGHRPLTPNQRDTLVHYFSTLRDNPVGWERLLPGRLRLMFPKPDFHLLTPEDEFRFMASDGQPYTLFLPPSE